MDLRHEISAELKDWLADFRRRHGRPLRVLHLSNVANNASSPRTGAGAKGNEEIKSSR